MSRKYIITDITLIGTGSMVYDLLQVADELQKQRVSVRVINIHTLKPFDEEIIEKAAEETGKILTVEDHSIYGGLGSIVAEVIAGKRLDVNFVRMGLKEFANGYGSPEDVKKMNGIGLEDVMTQIMRMLGK